MVKLKFEPIRFCIACRKKNKKKTLLRIVKLKNGGLNVDLQQTCPGRGTYVCCCENCFKILKKKRGLEKGLRCAVPEEIYLALENIIKGREIS